MLLNILQKILLSLFILFILSIMSFYILLRDPLNHFIHSDMFNTYFLYLQDLLQGDLGISYRSGELLTKQILTVFPNTILLCLITLIVSLIIGVPLGFLSAWKPKSVLGRILTTLGSLSLAVPVFWLAILALYYASNSPWFQLNSTELPLFYQISQSGGFQLFDIFFNEQGYRLEALRHLLKQFMLPVLVLSIPASLEIMRITQIRIEYVLQQNYIKFAQTLGWSPLKVWRKKVFYNTFPALIPMLTRIMILIFAFAMLIENIFSWGGIGRWLIQALAVEDYNAISAGVIAIGFFVLSIDLLTGIIILLLDPSNKKDWYDK